MGYTPLTVPRHAERPDRLWLHALLFVLTFGSTMMAGAAWTSHDPNEISNVVHGFTYAALLMFFLSSHEFGHYFAARIHGVRVTLPFFIPMPLLWLMPFGTMGALIRIKDRIQQRAALFDIGIAGPLAGFVVCCGILAYGFATVPPFDYLVQIHPEYAVTGVVPSGGMSFGETLIFAAFRDVFAPAGAYIPPMNEVYHYPFLCVGWFGLFVTALNLLPFGQLDGGHILASLIGRRQAIVGRVLWWVLFGAGFFALAGSVRLLLDEPSPEGWVIGLQQTLLPVLDAIYAHAPWMYQAGELWLFWALLVRFVVKVEHPPVADPQPLSPMRTLLGWLSFVIFIVCFSPRPIFIAP